MLSLEMLLVHVLEAAAIAAAIFLITSRKLELREFAMMVITITATFVVLDLFAPTVGVGARQGTGFGLGFTQIAGNGEFLPENYFVEGMDDKEALDYYNEFNPQEGPVEAAEEYEEN
jgi:hypothetical protein